MKSNNLFYLILFSCITLFTACEDKEDEKGSLEIQIQLVYDNEALVMYDEYYDYPDGSSIFFDRFNMFLTNASLTKGTEKDFAFDVRFLDFSDAQDKASAEKGISFILDDLTPKTYDGLELGLGVAPELNATSPSDYSSTHPLSNNYWSQWDSYIFTSIEGKADISGDGMYDHALTYHVGKDQAFTIKQLALPITISGGEKTTLKIKIDLLDLLSNGEKYVDIRNKPVDHSNDPEVYDFIIANLSNAVTIEEL